MIRVVVADDQSLVRAGLCAILDSQDDLEIVGEAGDGAQAVQVVRATRPDVVLMDIRMPGIDGIEATRQLALAGNLGRVLEAGGAPLHIALHAGRVASRSSWSRDRPG